MGKRNKKLKAQKKSFIIPKETDLLINKRK